MCLDLYDGCMMNGPLIPESVRTRQSLALAYHFVIPVKLKCASPMLALLAPCQCGDAPYLSIIIRDLLTHGQLPELMYAVIQRIKTEDRNVRKLSP